MKKLLFISLSLILTLGVIILPFSINEVAAAGNIIYVDANAGGGNDGTSWADACTDLQSALSAAVSGDEIRVAEGTYKPSVEVGGAGERCRCFQLKNYVSLLGGYPAGGGTRDPATNVSILSGDIGIEGDDSDNCYHVFYHPSGLNLDGTAVLDGFTITGGNADGISSHNCGGGILNLFSSPAVTNCIFVSNSAIIDGGGIYNDCLSFPMVTDCVFSRNSADNYGGGMYNHDNTSVVITNCTFCDNEANFGGGMYNDNTSPSLINCFFYGNLASNGGGMYNIYSMPEVTNCNFFNNSGSSDGGGIYNNCSSPILTDCTLESNSAYQHGGSIYNSSSSPSVTNCTFYVNSAVSHGGGIYNYSSTPKLFNCLFSGNSASNGGGMYNMSSVPELINCNFYDNSADSFGGGLYNENSFPPFMNCILWNDTPQEIYNNSSTPTVAYCNVQGGYTGTGNIDADPLFVDPSNNDYHLQAGSPCIDAGDNTAVPEGVSTDFEGDPRFLDDTGMPDTGSGTPPIVDMGADEYDGQSPGPGTQYTITATAGTGGSIMPSGDVMVDEGDNQDFIITPDAGYAIADVLVDGSSVGAVEIYTFTNVDASHTIEASFYTCIQYTITATAGTGGSIYPSVDVMVDEGDDQDFIITPDAGYAIADVLVDGVSVGAIHSYTFTNVDASHTIEASFYTYIQYTITATAGTGGSIYPSGDVLVIEGHDKSFSIHPVNGYIVDDVLVDGASVGAVTSYTFTAVEADHTIEALFKGSGWILLPSHTVMAMMSAWGSSYSDIFATGWWGTILHFDGNDWNPMYNPINTDLWGVWGSSGSDVFTVGSDGIILHYDGGIWSAMPSGTTKYLMGVWGSSGSDVFAVGSDGTILHFDGSVWSAMSSGTTKYLIGVWGSSGSDVFAMGSDGTILHYDGVGWSTIHGGTAKILNNVWNNSGSDIFGVGDDGTILHYDGAGWSAMSSGTDKDLWGVWGSSESDVFAVGNDGTILRYDGLGWSPVDCGYNMDIYCVWGSSGGQVFVFAEDGIILYYPGGTGTQYTITATAGTGGSITPSGDVIVDAGEDQTFIITPDAGYSIADVLVDGSSVGAVETYTFTNVDASHTIEASFNSTTAALTIRTVGGGSVTIKYSTGSAELTANPDPGWAFDSWSGDVTGTDNPVTVTLDNDKTVTAGFVESAPGMIPVTVQLLDSNSQGIAGAEVKYYDGGWKEFGTTGGSGMVTKDMETGTYKFRLYYGGASIDRTQDVASEATVVFRTVNATVE
ncbi:MAG: hypothetical protein JXA46_03560, partial [Dehalococcoidales bacterium]|nr:hypothetical protein [Dehalococcoidales bacterium]